jgi:O-antigen ligase
MKWLAYTSLAVTALLVFDTPRRMRALLTALAVAGWSVALLGIAQHLSGAGKIYWTFQAPTGAWIFGPYVNRNHFAGLMELWMPLALGLAIVPGSAPATRALGWLAAITMSSAVVLSGSRAGILVVVAEFALFTLWAAAQRGRRALIGSAAALLLIGACAAAIGGRGVDRLTGAVTLSSAAADPREEVTGHRIEAWQGTLAIAGQHWLLGAGLQGFAPLFPGARGFATDKFWSHAHNDILQFVAETGLIGTALMVGMFVLGGRSAARNLRAQAGTENGPLLAAVACACVGFLLHGWLDFNFHVPANAANFGVLAAMLVGRGWQQPGE